MPSRLGGAPATLPARPFSAASTALSAGSLMRATGAAPSRLTVRLANTLPRERISDARARTPGSIASQPGGSRSFRSSPLELTDLSSHAQA